MTGFRNSTARQNKAQRIAPSHDFEQHNEARRHAIVPRCVFWHSSALCTPRCCGAQRRMPRRPHRMAGGDASPRQKYYRSGAARLGGAALRAIRCRPGLGCRGRSISPTINTISRKRSDGRLARAALPPPSDPRPNDRAARSPRAGQLTVPAGQRRSLQVTGSPKTGDMSDSMCYVCARSLVCMRFNWNV